MTSDSEARRSSEGLLEVLVLRPEFSLFRAALIQHNLTDQIEQAGEYTVFAPTDSADVNATRYHVVLGRRLLLGALQLGGYEDTMLGFSYQLALLPQDGAVRRCCGGFFGKHCEACPAGGAGGGAPCSGHGTCSDGVDGLGVCACQSNFTGTACESCGPGKYGVHCDQECLCKSGRCSDGPLGDGTCACEVGWKGVLCNETVDPCRAGNGGCSPSAVCKRTQPGRRDCVCRPGYSGDGLVCVEINPCLDGTGGCHANADCIHAGPNKTLCTCHQGYTGDGQKCELIDLCLKNKGACHRAARCNMTGPGVRTCTCYPGYIGDGIACKGTVTKVSEGDEEGTGEEEGEGCIATPSVGNTAVTEKQCVLQISKPGIPLNGRGPFTVFAPNSLTSAPVFNTISQLLIKGNTDMISFAYIIQSHIVMCHALTASDLAQPRNITALSGEVLTTTASQGNVWVNKARVTYSDHASVNGIIHEVDAYLISTAGRVPQSSKPLDLKEVAVRSGYQRFSKLLEDTGVLEVLSSVASQPVTVFLPSDQALASLSQQQRDFLYDPHNRDQLLEYVRYHIIPNKKMYASELVHLDAVRTMQGSALQFGCGGTDAIGDIFVNGGTCRVVQRHLAFQGGLAYGIDCLLTPPSVGGRCDKHKSFEHTGVEKCDLPLVSYAKHSGCRHTCTFNLWQPKCCAGYYGRDCQACPGGVRSVCSNHGACDDGHLGNGTCKCDVGFQGVACELCAAGHHGRTCQGGLPGEQYLCLLALLPGRRLLVHTAEVACTQRGGAIATYIQLSYAQKAGYNLCSVGWLEGARAAYPTTYSNPNCGFGHVGIVDYGFRKNYSETWDTFCYRFKEVACACKPGYVGDGYTCTGNLLQVLTSTPMLSNFLATLSAQDLEHHLSEGRAVALSDMRDGRTMKTRQGSLSIQGVVDLLNPELLSSCYVNDRYITQPDVAASNGVIHVLQGPLQAPPPPHTLLRVEHQVGMGAGLVLLLVLVGVSLLVAYRFHAHKAKPFKFAYFKDEGEEEEGEESCPPPTEPPSISNPLYGTAAPPSPPQPALHSFGGL
ncbi:hypothetical protein CRUP_025338 [Coryphaenoides rupestris]|nr:hypothetical protein CRUP_025338 [Coryphaenoides rupestris]